ncbi:MAG: PQQ-dependent sugar dehydrogenase [Pseudomonadota bacterium]|uniref:PQQ-dependent sugar dehydrogenase n=1 Tax=Phenylobacterium sp. TaxID=1871053 RepID=UPI0025D05FD3|nr:PQQ-dependent sugar dehydrogenase [Phenylobacterium sp.]MBT9470624.1 PQQ-dependent sugar dehydrogenase [Phenylobacterium sp.]
MLRSQWFGAMAVVVGVTALAAGVSSGIAQQPAGAPAAGPPGGGPLAASREVFTQNCVACHGADLAGGRAPSLFDERRMEGRTDEQLRATISKGLPDTEMPAFGEALSEEQIWQLVAYVRVEGANVKGAPRFVPSPVDQVVKSEKQDFRIEVLTAGLDVPWGLAFLPDGRLLVTERTGRLRIIQNGKLQPEPVTGTPRVWARQDGGMLDVAVHPNYAKNGWIYLAYTEAMPGWTPPPTPAGVTLARPPSPPSMTVLVRGKLNSRNEWVQSQEIFRAPYSLYTSSGAHYGLRMLFDREGHLFYSLGERGEMANAQNLSTPLGKIHRINDDGSVPKDNPFVNTPGAVPTIWSYGHRNPQGLAFDPVTGLLWSSEHGPTAGDEINIVEKGKNYGWGVITAGVQRGLTKRSEPGMEQPIVYYTPTIAPSGVSFYAGDRYPGWKNNLFVAALAGQHLRRLEIKGREVVHQEVLFGEYGRTRAVITGPDGLLYALLQNPTGAGTGLSLSAATPGMVIRLNPLAGRKP